MALQKETAFDSWRYRCLRQTMVLRAPGTNMTAGSTQSAERTVTNADMDLVHASKNGDVAAFEQLIKRYDRRLLRIAHHITHNREDPQFSTWLIRITVNQSLMKLRKRRTMKEVSLDHSFQPEGDTLPREVADWAPNPEQRYRASELRNILTRVFGELRPILRAVFVLRDIEGLSTDQTAEVLGLSHPAVKARLWRARLQLRESLTRYFCQQGESAPRESGSAKDATETLKLQVAAWL